MKTPRQELRALAQETKQLLKRMEKEGGTTVPGQPRTPQANKDQILEPIRKKAFNCQACRLSKTRQSVVFGEGSLDADLVFVGEGPGREEDAQGRPFVGAAGQLLTKMIEAMGLKREQVYIANVVKCRPPENRLPEPDEIAACEPYLKAQLETIQPKVICALGKTAASALLATHLPMNQLRGKTFQWQTIPLKVTFHPAYLLRNPPAKALVWEDLKQVMALLSLKAPR